MSTTSEPSTNPFSHYLIDTVVAGCAGFSLAWFITPMDAAVMENMSGRNTILKSLEGSVKHIAFRPHTYPFIPAFRIVFGTYAATYLAKNYTNTWCKSNDKTPEMTAFLTTWTVFAVNGGLSVFWKDPALAIIYGTKKSTSGRMPVGTYFWWCCRDILHIIGAAVMPDYLEQKMHLTIKQWEKIQLSFPVLIQIVTTPCHLFGLDYYNFVADAENKIKFSARVGRVARGILPSIGVRCIRMFAPWSLGLVINRHLRDYLIKEYS